TAFVNIGGIKGIGGSDVDVTFANNGLLISNGSRVSLEVSFTSQFLVGPVTFGTKNLEFSYVVATNTFQMLGTAYLEVGGIQGIPGQNGNQVSVTFANNGLVITNGSVVSLDVAINSSFRVGSATITVQNLEFD